MSRLQALATRAHASNPWPSTLCGSPSVVPPTITVVERGRIRGGSVRRRSNAGWRGLSIPSPILQRFRRSGRAILAQTYLATSSLRLSLEGYAFIRGPVLPSRGRYPMISRALSFLFSMYSCTRSIFPLSRLREMRRELSALLSFQNPRIKARAMNGRRTYFCLDTTFNSDETDIRIFQFLRFDLTSVLGARSREKEREKRSFLEHRDQVVRESDVVLAPV